MDKQTLPELIEKYKDVVIRLNQHLLNKIGLEKNSAVLKINDYYIHCIPYTMSLNGCHAVSVLSEREAAFFGAYLRSLHNFYLEFNHPVLSKKIRLFIRSELKGIRTMNASTKHSVLDISFRTVPVDFQEIMVMLLGDLESLKAKYENGSLNTRTVDYPVLKDTKLEREVMVRFGENERQTARIIRAGFKSITLFLDNIPGASFEKGSEFQIEYFMESFSFFGKGTIMESRPSQEIPETSILTASLDYTAGLVELIAPHLEGYVLPG